MLLIRECIACAERVFVMQRGTRSWIRAGGRRARAEAGGRRERGVAAARYLMGEVNTGRADSG